ncbi:hypothetical protein SAMN02745166_03689 [Prosthecobacter debontii]|uniref:Uncharacterized protein n=1 Tax=Prosthecobacter debontii TaxID=48467 RepID=A0A1T4YNJ2_9BACT|nr:hypothetical protein [Prosthecobacter debontii]SKB02801.1 hypothetical protein SAMN02745166_03689 [Prosthecobacter debontii]
MPQLSPEQLAQVEIWAADGATLNQVQDRLKTEFGITLTYLDARLLMLDVGVRIKDKPREPEKVAETAPVPEANLDAEDAEVELADDESSAPGSLEMTTDQIAIPGALISGKVVFSDGQNASWFLDQMGRLGLSGAPQGYQPPPQDIPLFQQQLDLFLQKAGF